MEINSNNRNGLNNHEWQQNLIQLLYFFKYYYYAILFENLLEREGERDRTQKAF